MSRLKQVVATIALAILALSLVAACSNEPVSPTPTGQVPGKTASPTSTSGSNPTAAPGATVKPITPPAASGLNLSIVQPQIESVVTGSLLEVKGQTNPDAIVSVNGVIVKFIDVNGNFTAVVPLEEGPNLIEIVASDYQNNQVSQTLTVIYAPQG